MPLEGVHALSPRTCEYVTLCGKRDFAGMIKAFAVAAAVVGCLRAIVVSQRPWKREAGG